MLLLRYICLLYFILRLSFLFVFDIQGEEYLYIQDWGEQLVGKKYSVLVQYNIESDSAEVLEGIPEDVCAAQPIYSPDGDYIIGVGYKITPRKLGLIYCSNRASSIFKLDFQGNYGI